MTLRTPTTPPPNVDATPEPNGVVRRVVSWFDPARPGCRSRFLVTLAVVLATVACLATTALLISMRTPSARYLTSAFLLEVGFEDVSTRMSRSLLEDYPTRSAAYYQLHEAGLKRQGRHEELLGVLRMAVERLPESPRAHTALCAYTALYGDPIEAIPHCDEGVRLSEGPRASAFTRAHRAMARGFAGDLAGAREDLKDAMDAGESLAKTEPDRPWRAWHQALRAGRNPFDEETRERERARQFLATDDWSFP